MKRKIPAVMVSQHPDNANKPFWHTDAYIRDHDEVKECYFVFSKLNVAEYKWDWEGKFVDESVFERLISTYPPFFHKNQLGREKFGFMPPYIRPYFARSDSALSSGLVLSVLAIKIALSRHSKFTKDTGIEMTDLIEEAAILRRSLG